MELEKLNGYSRKFVRMGVYTLILCWFIWIWAPLLWDITRGFAANPQSSNLVPTGVTLEHYRAVLVEEHFTDYVINSTVVTLVSTSISLIIGSLAAYSLTRYNPGDGKISFYILSMRFLPPVSLAIPLYLVFINIGWIDTWQSLIVAYLTLGVPIVTWIMIIFFKKISVRLEEASRMDGWSRLQTWWRVVLPLAAPGISSAAIFAGILIWNEFVLALVLTTTRDAQTIPIYLSGFVTTRGILWGRMGAAMTIAITPVLLLAFLMQERLTAGFAMQQVE